MRKVSRRVSSRIPERLKRKRAAFGVDAAIILAFVIGVAAVLIAAGPWIIGWIANAIVGGPDNAYTLFLELPILDQSQNATRLAQQVGKTADSMYGTFQGIGVALLSVVLIIAAMCYIFETFRFMSEGTAMNIILNSVFALIMIFAVKYIYNGVAAAINAFTGWPSVGGTGLIIKSGDEIRDLLNAMGGATFEFSGGPLDAIGAAFARLGLFAIMLVVIFSVMVTAVMTGVVRVLLAGCLAIVLPLLLMLRLIPFTKHFADSLIETLIGIMFASIIGAIFLHFGWMLISPQGGHVTGLYGVFVAAATFLGTALMSTVFAGRLGALFTGATMIATAAGQTATAAIIGGAMVATGGVAGGAGALKALGGAAKGALNTMAGQAATGGGGAGGGGAGGGLAVGGMGKAEAFLRGAASGMKTAAKAAIPGILLGSPSMLIRHAPTAIAASGEAGAAHVQSLIAERAGSALEGLLYSFALTPAEGQSSGEGTMFLQQASKMSDRALGETFLQRVPELSGQVDPELAGREIRKMLNSMSGAPLMIDRINKHSARFSKLPAEKRGQMLEDALVKKDDNRKRVEAEVVAGGGKFYDPFLELADRKPGFYHAIMDKETVGVEGEALKAKFFAAMREGYEERYEKGKLDYEIGWNLGQNLGKMSDEEVFEWARQNFNAKAYSNEQKKAIANQLKALALKLSYDNPYLLTNLAHNVKTKSSVLTRPFDEDLKSLNDNMSG